MALNYPDGIHTVCCDNSDDIVSQYKCHVKESETKIAITDLPNDGESVYNGKNSSV